MDLKVLQASLDLSDLLVQQDNRVQKAQVEMLVIQVLLDPLDLLGHQDNLEIVVV